MDIRWNLLRDEAAHRFARGLTHNPLLPKSPHDFLVESVYESSLPRALK